MNIIFDSLSQLKTLKETKNKRTIPGMLSILFESTVSDKVRHSKRFYHTTSALTKTINNLVLSKDSQLVNLKIYEKTQIVACFASIGMMKIP